MPEPIYISAYNEQWPLWFKETGGVLRSILGSTAIRIDHIGSTSVPQLDAKPVIDIQVSVASLDAVELIHLPMEREGFVFRAANPDQTKRYFRERPGTRRTHIHVRKAGSFSEQLALLFRDYLRCHNEDRMKYAEEKYKLAAQYSEAREAYTKAKAPIIWEIMQKADLWSQLTGWTPPPSDM